MTDVNILSLFGIGIAELEAYEQTDSGDGWVAFRIRKAKGDRPCPVCGAYGCHVKDYTALLQGQRTVLRQDRLRGLRLLLRA